MSPTVDHPAAEREPDHVTPEPMTFVPRYGWIPTAHVEASQAAYDALPAVDAAACGACDGSGTTGSLDTDVFECTVCDGTGLSAQHRAAELPDTDIRSALAADLGRMGLMSEPEKRTVSVEVLTDELRNPPLDPDIDPAATIWIPPHARVGIVLRADGVFVAVVETDADWIKKHGPVALLTRLLQQAEHYARDGEATLVMPLPDVLAALDGRPDAQLLTAPVHVLAMDIKAGMLLRSTDDDGDGAETLELVSAERDCDDAECIHGTSCVVLTVSGHEDPDVHFGGFGRIEVRIPVSVTR